MSFHEEDDSWKKIGGGDARRRRNRRKQVKGGADEAGGLSPLRLEIMQKLAEETIEMKKSHARGHDAHAPHLIAATSLLNCLRACSMLGEAVQAEVAAEVAVAEVAVAEVAAEVAAAPAGVTCIVVPKQGGVDRAELADSAKAALDIICPMLDLSPMISMYIMLQPYKIFKAGEMPLIAESLIEHWRGSPNIDNANTVVQEYLSYFVRRPGCACADSAIVEEAIDRVRQDIEQAPPAKAQDIILEAYAVLQRENKIGAVTGVFPVPTFEVLSMPMYAGLLVWQDSFRMTIGACIDRIFHAPIFDAVIEADFKDLIASIAVNWSGSDYAKELTFLNANGNRIVGSKFDRLEQFKFANSSDFLYRANESDQVGKPSGSLNPSDEELYNRNGWTLAWLCKIRPEVCQNSPAFRDFMLAERHRAERMAARRVVGGAHMRAYGRK